MSSWWNVMFFRILLMALKKVNTIFPNEYLVSIIAKFLRSSI